MATDNPWYGYQRIAVMCRRLPRMVKDLEAYCVMREHHLLQRPQPRAAELCPTARLFDLLPQNPHDLWQMDVIRGRAGISAMPNRFRPFLS
jgi:hypothetical protein